MVVSLLDFLRTGRLGGIELGMSLETVEKLFGEPFVREESVQVLLWMEGETLSKIDLRWTNSTAQLGEILRCREDFNRFSTHMVLDWCEVSPSLAFEQLHNVFVQLDLIYSESSYISYQMNEIFILKSGVMVEVENYEYIGFSCSIGEIGETAYWWREDVYWERSDY